MLRKFIVFGAIALILFLVIGMFLPESAHLEQTIEIKAPAETVFSQVNEVENHKNWLPFKLLDPEIEFTFSDKKAGEGAAYTWNGKSSGEGSLEILESIPHSLVRLVINLPNGATASGVWTFQEANGGTLLKMTMEFESATLIHRYLGQVLENLFGPIFEKSLQEIKTQSEKQPR